MAEEDYSCGANCRVSSQVDARPDYAVYAGCIEEGQKRLAPIQTNAELCADQGEMDQARWWLEQSLLLVPIEYRLQPEGGATDDTESGVAYWLVSARTYYYQGTWKLREAEQVGASSERYQDLMEQAIEQLALAAVCYHRYWPETQMSSIPIRVLAQSVKAQGFPLETARTLISKAFFCYNVSLKSSLNSTDIFPESPL